MSRVQALTNCIKVNKSIHFFIKHNKSQIITTVITVVDEDFHLLPGILIIRCVNVWSHKFIFIVFLNKLPYVKCSQDYKKLFVAYKKIIIQSLLAF